MTQTPNPETVAVWTRLIAASGKALDAIEGALKAAGMPALEWYDALLEIERAGTEGVRPFALKERLLLPQYGISRLLARMEAAGLVAREASEADGRGQVVFITDTGRAMRRAMWPVYAAAMERVVGCKLDAPQKQMLAVLLERLT